MNILHISYSDSGGGAAIGARRIHEALLEQGVDSRMLCIRVSSSTQHVVPVFGRFKTKVNGLVNRILWHALHGFHRTGNKNLHSFNFLPTGLHRIINKSDADIVNLHWINNEMISIREIAKIKKTVVWTLHDMWPISGAAHNSLGEYYARFESGYQTLRPAGDRWPDLDVWTWKRKKKYWKDFNPCFVAVSAWMADNVQKSALFSLAHVQVIPNTVDLRVFKPMDKQLARAELDLPSGKNIIVFACTSAPYKGMDLMVESLRGYYTMAGPESFLAVAFGRNEGITDLFSGLPVRFVGRINSESELAKLYCAADVTCVPSLIESFGQTAAESMACGTPAVVYACSGLVDIVDHRENGYAAIPFDIDDFTKGIQWVLSQKEADGYCLNESESPVCVQMVEGCVSGEVLVATEGSSYEKLCRSGIEKTIRCFSSGVVASKYSSLYSAITSGK